MKKFFAVVFALMILTGTAYAADENSWNSDEEKAGETNQEKVNETQSGLAALAKNPEALKAAVNVAKARAKQKEMAEGTKAEY